MINQLELGYTPKNPPKDTKAALVLAMLSLGLWFVCPISHLQALINGPASLCHCSNSIHLVIHCADSPRLPGVLIYAWIQCSFYPSLAWEKFMAWVLEE